ncbi:MAG: ACT domain-containing protein [Ilumatobacteraceae bacterium]
MNLYRIRFRAADSPGRLGAAASALGALGVNILSVDVQSVDGDEIVDDLVVELTVPIDLPAIEVALRGRGRGAPPRAGRPPRSARSDHRMPRRPPPPGPRARPRGAGRRRSLAGSSGSRRRHRPVGRHRATGRHRRGGALEQHGGARRRLRAATRRAGAGPFVALPFDSALVGRVLLLRRRPAFSATEVARVASLLRFSPVFAGDQRVRWAHGAA